MEVLKNAKTAMPSAVTRCVLIIIPPLPCKYYQPAGMAVAIEAYRQQPTPIRRRCITCVKLTSVIV
jgi:hypothetical protein